MCNYSQFFLILIQKYEQCIPVIIIIITVIVIIFTNHGVRIERHDDPGDTKVGNGEGDDKQVCDVLKSTLLVIIIIEVIIHQDNDLCNGKYDEDVSKDDEHTEEKKGEGPIVFACAQSLV